LHSNRLIKMQKEQGKEASSPGAADEWRRRRWWRSGNCSWLKIPLAVFCGVIVLEVHAAIARGKLAVLGFLKTQRWWEQKRQGKGLSQLRMVASGVAEISAAASMEDCWMFTVWKSCWGWNAGVSRSLCMKKFHRWRRKNHTIGFWCGRRLCRKSHLYRCCCLRWKGLQLRLVQRKWGAGPEGAGWKMLVVPLLSLLVVGDWRWRRLKEKKVRSAEGKESEVQEGVCGGWYFVLATEREVPGGRRRLYHTRRRIDLGSIPGFIG